MNHSGIGKVDESGGIHLPMDVLSPLSITKGVTIWGIYYPAVSEAYENKNKLIKYDLVLSPIPFDLWGKVVRVKIRLKQIPNAHRKITETIFSLGASILFSESSRSAHSYDTWTLVVSFEDLGDVDYVDNTKAYSQTLDSMERLSDTLISQCSDVIFADKCDEVCHNLVHITSYSAMSYFYHMVHKYNTGEIQSAEEGAFEPFMLECRENGIFESKDNKLKGILNHINKSKDKIYPSKLFCEVDTNDINIRMCIIRKSQEHKFFNACFEFIRSGKPASSKGLLNYILSRFPNNYAIWKVSTISRSSDPLYEEGRVEFLIKDAESENTPNITRKKELESLINPNNLPDFLSQIYSINIKSSSLNNLLRSNRKIELAREDEYDIFISYSTDDKDIAKEIYKRITGNNYKCFLSEKNITAGKDFTDEIRDALKGSRELLILYSDNANNSEWVKQEYGAAWALEMHVVPVLLDMPSSRLPDWLRNRQAYPYHKFDKYLEELKDRDI